MRHTCQGCGALDDVAGTAIPSGGTHMRSTNSPNAQSAAQPIACASAGSDTAFGLPQQTVSPLSLRQTLGEGDARRWFALNGGRLYCVQTLTGMFPDTGWHQPGEMGGLWAPPIKLMDGYWLGLRPARTVQSAHAASMVAGATDATGAFGAAAGPDEAADTTWLTQPDFWELTAEGALHRYTLPSLGLVVTRRAWIIPDASALVLDVSLASLASHETRRGSEAPREIECGLFARSDLHGAWLSEERLGLADGDDAGVYDPELGIITFGDTLHPDWTACMGAVGLAPVTHAIGKQVWGPQHTAGRGVGAALWYRLSLPDAQPARLSFLLTGPLHDGQSASATFRHYATSMPASRAKPGRLEQAHNAARERFAAPFTRCILRSPDAAFDEVFAWAKANLTWLYLTIPGIGSAPMGGIADFPWWFGCDSEYGLLPMLAAGQQHEASAALRTLATLSQRANGNGRVVHEISSNGVVNEPGNLVETALFTRTLHAVYRWTGDRALLRDLYPFCARGLLGYALGACREADEVVPQGRSMVETPEMHANVQTLDVAAYCAEALDLLAELRDELGAEAEELDATNRTNSSVPAGPRTSADMRAEAKRIRRRLRDEWWLPQEDLFGDVRASEDELRRLLARLEANASADPSVRLSIGRLRGALASDERRAEREPPNQRRPWLFLHYEQALAAEAGLPTSEQARRIFRRLATPEWLTEYGIVLNAATDRQVMSLPTGALAVALARYGEADAALDMILRLTRAFGKATPGTISEYSPDGGCFLQLWSSYGVIWPVVRYIFGLDPDVGRRQVICAPQLPTAWPSARLAAIPLGDTLADVRVTVAAGETTVTLTLTDSAWEVALGVASPAESAQPTDGKLLIPTATLNGQPTPLARAAATSADGAGQRHLWLAPPQRGALSHTLRVRWPVPDGPTSQPQEPQ